MRTKEEALKIFETKPPDPDLDIDRISQHRGVEIVFLRAVDMLWVLLPDGPGKTVALRNLQMAQLSCNACIENEGQ